MLITETFGLLKHLKDYPKGIKEGTTDIVKRPNTINKPLVLLHGFISNVSIWNSVRDRFKLLGWENIYKYNYHVFKKSINYITQEFNLYMDDILESYEYDVKISFIGHSLGGIIIRDWVTKSDNHVWVDKVITLGSPHQGSNVAHIARFIPLRFRHIGRDLTPKSDYMKILNLRPQPPNVKWYAINAEKDELVLPRRLAKYPDHWESTEVIIGKIGHIYLAYAPETTLLCHKFLIE